MPGFICLDRDHFFGGAFANEPRVYSRNEALIDLYQRAAHSPHVQMVSGKHMRLDTGEQIASERFLEARWGWSRTKVRKFIGTLKENHEIDHRKDQGETVLILVKYRALACAAPKKEPAEEPPKEPEKDQGSTTKEPKENKGNEGNEGKPTPPSPRGGARARFRKPSVAEVEEYGLTLTPPFREAEAFHDYYESQGWVIGRAPMKDWKATVRNWNRKRGRSTASTLKSRPGHDEDISL